MRTIRIIERQELYNEKPVKKITIDSAKVYKAWNKFKMIKIEQ